MVKPRVFVSSTYYDLKYIRNSLQNFITNIGYEAVLFEGGGIPYNHQIPLDESCYSEVNKCHMLILIIGGRYGSSSSKSRDDIDEKICRIYKSVTMNEYRSARDKDIPIFVFVDKNVYSEYRTYRENFGNACNINYAYVDNVKVFELLDEINSQQRNNPIKEFDKFEDIANWLKEQWAGLFAEYLQKQQDQKILSNISEKIEELSQVSKTLKEYTESIMKKVEPDNFQKIIRDENEKIELLNKRLFLSNDLINYILQSFPKLDKEELYSTFKQTSTFENFLEKIGIDERIKSMLINSGVACNDYMDLRSKVSELEINR